MSAPLIQALKALEGSACWKSRLHKTHGSSGPLLMDLRCIVRLLA
jgi:hypothetical protein